MANFNAPLYLNSAPSLSQRTPPSTAYSLANFPPASSALVSARPTVKIPAFCCDAALPTNTETLKLHRDPNRTIHEAIFRSFIAYAVRSQAELVRHPAFQVVLQKDLGLHGLALGKLDGNWADPGGDSCKTDILKVETDIKDSRLGEAFAFRRSDNSTFKAQKAETARSTTATVYIPGILRDNPLNSKIPYVIHLTSRKDFGPVESHRYLICPTNLHDNWLEISHNEWFAEGQPFELNAITWDLKCSAHGKFFRLALRPNLKLRDCVPVYTPVRSSPGTLVPGAKAGENSRLDRTRTINSSSGSPMSKKDTFKKYDWHSVSSFGSGSGSASKYVPGLPAKSSNLRRHFNSTNVRNSNVQNTNGVTLNGSARNFQPRLTSTGPLKQDSRRAGDDQFGDEDGGVAVSGALNNETTEFYGSGKDKGKEMAFESGDARLMNGSSTNTTSFTPSSSTKPGVSLSGATPAFQPLGPITSTTYYPIPEYKQSTGFGEWDGFGDGNLYPSHDKEQYAGQHAGQPGENAQYNHYDHHENISYCDNSGVGMGRYQDSDQSAYSDNVGLSISECQDVYS